MTFYGERFHRKDEEDIWEQLKQMLLNPASDEEIALNKQQEQAKNNVVENVEIPKVEESHVVSQEEIISSMPTGNIIEPSETFKEEIPTINNMVEEEPIIETKIEIRG